MRNALLLWVLMAAAWAYPQESADIRHFDYDAHAPVEVKEVGVERRGSVSIHDLSYASPKGGRVPAYLVVPEGKGPFAAIVWGHWYWATSEFANRKEFLEEAVALAPAGAISLLTTGPIGRPGYEAPKSPFTDESAAYMVQQVIDMRRAADLLLARKDVDPKRLAYVGHSYNSSVGGILSGIDKRFKAYVLMAGALSFEVDRKTKPYQDIRNRMGGEKFDAVLAKYSFLDPGRYASYARPAAVFLQYATKENFITPDVSRQYADIVSQPKTYKVYEAPHALNAAARKDRIEFLIGQLRLKKKITAANMAQSPQLPQPEP
jgi:cephalosporin-C deacetylase-like acetyl esterase